MSTTERKTLYASFCASCGHSAEPAELCVHDDVVHDVPVVLLSDYEKLDACVDSAKAYIEVLEEPNSMALRVAMLEDVVRRIITGEDVVRLGQLFDYDTAALVEEVLERGDV